MQPGCITARRTTTVLVSAVALAAAALAAAFGAGASAAAAPAHGCGGHASGSGMLTLSIGGHSRTVIVHVPSAYRGTTKVPLVLNMHGSGSTAADQELFTGMDATADADGFIVAYPQGLIPDGTGFDWNVPGEPLIGGASRCPRTPPTTSPSSRSSSACSRQRYCINPAARLRDRLLRRGPHREPARLRLLRRVRRGRGGQRPAPPEPVPDRAGRCRSSLPRHRRPDRPLRRPRAGLLDLLRPAGRSSTGRSRTDARRRPAISKPTRASRSRPTRTAAAAPRSSCTRLPARGTNGRAGRSCRRLTSLLGPQSSAINANNVMWAFFAAHPLP
jgi:polyhydroxybutyrate depolymerase